MLESIKANTADAGKIDNLLYVIEHDLGFQLYRAVEQTKVGLSTQQKASFVFRELPGDIECEVSRGEFEEWIRPCVTDINGCVDGFLRDCNVRREMVDTVFLTGGSSFVPLVRESFAAKFGAESLRGGKELTSIGEGLSLRALSLQQER
jgi:hypothetical chaperone protein